MNIGQRIKELRKSKGLSQDQLAEASGLNRNSIYNYETGKRDPGVETLKEICKALDITLSDMLKQDIPTTLQEKINFLLGDNISLSDISNTTGLPIKDIRDFLSGKNESIPVDSRMQFEKSLHDTYKFPEVSEEYKETIGIELAHKIKELTEHIGLLESYHDERSQKETEFSIEINCIIRLASKLTKDQYPIIKSLLENMTSKNPEHEWISYIGEYLEDNNNN